MDCRICRSTEPIEDLREPCNCQGSIRYVHKQCLSRWLVQRDPGLSNIRCEICGYPLRIRVDRLPVTSVLKRVGSITPFPYRLGLRYVFRYSFHGFYSSLVFRQFRQETLAIAQRLVSYVRYPAVNARIHRLLSLIFSLFYAKPPLVLVHILSRSWQFFTLSMRLCMLWFFVLYYLTFLVRDVRLVLQRVRATFSKMGLVIVDIENRR